MSCAIFEERMPGPDVMSLILLAEGQAEAGRIEWKFPKTI